MDSSFTDRHEREILLSVDLDTSKSFVSSKVNEQPSRKNRPISIRKVICAILSLWLAISIFFLMCMVFSRVHHTDTDVHPTIEPDYSFHNTYHSIQEYYQFYRDKNLKDLVTVETLGKTPEGRDFLGLTIGNEAKNGKIWINCGSHAREWASFSTCAYIFDIFAKSKSDRILEFLNTKIIYMSPALNPDGYEYSRTKGNREWRKTRQKVKGAKGNCLGIDLARNMPAHFEDRIDSSTNPCTENFGGLQALDAKENQLLFDWLITKNNIAASTDMHAYGLQISTPYGYKQEHPPHFDDQIKAGTNTIEAIKKLYGTEYEIGSTFDLIYGLSGDMTDFAYDTLGAKCALTYEIRGKYPSKKTHPFRLPEKEIIPNGQEMVEAILSLGRDMDAGLCINLKEQSH